MGIRITSIGSSSSGNSYLIRSEQTTLLLDLGLSAKKIKEALSQNNIEKQDVAGVLITHEHIDHVKSVRQISKDCDNARFFASRGTIDNTDKFDHVEEERINYVQAGDSFAIGDIIVKAFELSHDAAEPLGFSFSSGGDYLSVVTDTGIITEEIMLEMKKANKLVFESNHEEQMLLMGPYPYTVKRRILSDHGHLSNIATGEVLAEVLNSHCEQFGQLQIMLAHLSDTNNTAYQARITVCDILRESGFENNRDYSIIVAAKEGITEL